MNKEIEELAEKEYSIEEPESGGYYPDSAIAEAERDAFIKGAELSIGFAEWCGFNGYTFGNPNWFDSNSNEIGTTQQLFTQYLNTKK